MWKKILKVTACMLAGGACIALAVFIPPLGIVGAGLAATAFTVSLSATGGAVAIGGTAYFVFQGAAPPDPNPGDPAVAAAAAQANNVGNQVVVDLERHMGEFTRILQERIAVLEAELKVNRDQTAQLIVNFHAERERLISQLNRIEDAQREIVDNMRNAGVFTTRRGPQGGRATAANQPAEPVPAAANEPAPPPVAGFNNH